MKIALITSLPSLKENQRIKEEVEALGHQFQLIDLSQVNFFIKKKNLTLPGLTDLNANLVIFRGMLNHLRLWSPLITSLRSRGIKVFDNNLSSHQYSINKITDLVKLSLEKIPVPATAYTANLEDYPSLANKFGFPLVIKSTRAGKGVGVYKINTPADLKSFITQAKKDDKTGRGFIVQEFIPYLYDLRILLIGSHAFAMRRIPSQGEFRANFSLGGQVEPFSPRPETIKLAKRALRAVDLKIAGVDILITKNNQEYVLETNHIPGFVGMEKATGKNIGRAFIKEAINSSR